MCDVCLIDSTAYEDLQSSRAAAPNGGWRDRREHALRTWVGLPILKVDDVVALQLRVAELESSMRFMEKVLHRLAYRANAGGLPVVSRETAADIDERIDHAPTLF